MSDDIRWIRSYVLEEDGGSVGTVCIYQASSPEAIRDHASRADLPVDEIIPVERYGACPPRPSSNFSLRPAGRRHLSGWRDIGRSCKNQGDCVSFVATTGRTLIFSRRSLRLPALGRVMRHGAGF
jgi:hypothetical protein